MRMRASRRQLLLYDANLYITHPVLIACVHVFDPPGIEVLINLIDLGSSKPGSVVVPEKAVVVRVCSIQVTNARNNDAGATSCVDTVRCSATLRSFSCLHFVLGIEFTPHRLTVYITHQG